MKQKQAPPKRLSLVQFCYWGGTTVMVSFMVIFLREAGYSDIQSGLVASWVAAGTMLLQPALGFLSDSVFPARKLLVACFAVGLPVALVLPMLGQGLLLSAGVVALSLLCEPQATLIDNYIIRMKEKAPEVDYGKVRAWGPMGSATAALLAGTIGWLAALRPMFYLVAGFFALCLLLLSRCEEMSCPNKRAPGNATGASTGFRGAIYTLLHTPVYLLFIGCCSLFQFAMRTATTFLGLVVAEAGGGSLELGLLLCVVYAGQMPFIHWAGRRLDAGVGCEKIFWLAMGLGTLRLSLFGLGLPFGIMLVTQLLQAAQTGLYTRVFVQHITDIIPRNIHATATSIGAAVSLGTGQMVGGIVHGRVIASAGAGASALLSAGVMAGTLVLFVLGSLWLHKREQKQVAGT